MVASICILFYRKICTKSLKYYGKICINIRKIENTALLQSKMLFTTLVKSRLLGNRVGGDLNSYLRLLLLLLYIIWITGVKFEYNSIYVVNMLGAVSKDAIDRVIIVILAWDWNKYGLNMCYKSV